MGLRQRPHSIVRPNQKSPAPPSYIYFTFPASELYQLQMMLIRIVVSYWIELSWDRNKRFRKHNDQLLTHRTEWFNQIRVYFYDLRISDVLNLDADNDLQR